jgi:hypothetical protein
VQVTRISINGREFGVIDPEAAQQVLRDIEAAATNGSAWVTIPIRETNAPRVLVTPHVDCFVEVLELPDDDPEADAAFPFGFLL